MIVSCSWPIGEPHTEGFRFCGAECPPWMLFCPEHASHALVQVQCEGEPHERRARDKRGPAKRTGPVAERAEI